MNKSVYRYLWRVYFVLLLVFRHQMNAHRITNETISYCIYILLLHWTVHEFLCQMNSLFWFRREKKTHKTIDNKNRWISAVFSLGHPAKNYSSACKNVCITAIAVLLVAIAYYPS